jgi:hypothetical protein
MCASGWTESYQIRRGFGIHAYISAMALFFYAGRSRHKLPIPNWLPPLMVFSALVAVAAVTEYNHQIKKFWDEIGPQWREHERILSEDRRNQMTD